MAIVGQVGCGKSSVMAALLGDVEKVSGNVAVQVGHGSMLSVQVDHR